MNKKVKIAVSVTLVLLLTSATVAYFMWHKPKRDVADEKGIEISAAQLVKDYQGNEDSSNLKYLNQAIQVTGTVTEVKNNQEGKPTVMLASGDAFAGVFCTLKENSEGLSKDSTVTLKGICSGMLSDVRLRDAVVVKK